MEVGSLHDRVPNKVDLLLIAIRVSASFLALPLTGPDETVASIVRWS